jgi:hypothetical protein
MRKLILILTLCSAAPAFARGYYGNVEGKSFGIGLIIGDPTGLSAELKLSQRTAIDFALGITTFQDHDWYFHLDYLLSPVDLSPSGSVGVPIYLGVGAFFDGFNNSSNTFGAGARVPLGIAFEMRTLPLQFFLELGFDFRLIETNCGGCSQTAFILTGDGGFRIFF